MGASLSRNITTNLLLYNVKNEIRDLMNNYEFWSNGEICKNLEVVYREKLIKLTEDQLMKINVSIGYEYTKPIDKTTLCETIVTHYKKRIELLQYIDLNINTCADMIHRAKNGQVCKNVNQYINDFFVCDKIPNALWIDKEHYKILLNSLRKHDNLSVVIKWIEKLESQYHYSLKKLLRVIELMKKDIDNTVSKGEFDSIYKYTVKTVEHMNTLCEIYFLLAVNYK
jgi:hypothetical protein